MKYLVRFTLLALCCGLVQGSQSASQQPPDAAQQTRKQTASKTEKRERERKEKEAAKLQSEEAGVRCTRLRKRT